MLLMADPESRYDSGANAPPAVHLYIPRRLLRRLPRVPLALVGWAVQGGPGELVLVLACALSLAHALKAGLRPISEPAMSDTEGLEPCLLGVCASGEPRSEDAGKGRAADELGEDATSVWIEASAVLKKAGKLRRGNASLQLNSWVQYSRRSHRSILTCVPSQHQAPSHTHCNFTYHHRHLLHSTPAASSSVPLARTISSRATNKRASSSRRRRRGRAALVRPPQPRSSKAAAQAGGSHCD